MSKLTDDLDTHLRIVNAWGFALRAEVPFWIAYRIQHPHAQGYNDRRADVWRRVPGGTGGRAFEKVATLRPNGGLVRKDARIDALQQAAAWLTEHHGYTPEWRQMPYGTHYIDAAAYDAVMAELKAARKAAKAAARAHL